MRVQEHFRFLTQRFAEVFFIQFLNIRVVVRFAQRFVGVFPVKGGGTPAKYLHTASVERLSATADTSSRTSHHLDRMIRRGTVLHLLDQFAGIPQTMSDTDLYRSPIKIDRSATNTLQPA